VTAKKKDKDKEQEQEKDREGEKKTERAREPDMQTSTHFKKEPYREYVREYKPAICSLGSHDGYR